MNYLEREENHAIWEMAVTAFEKIWLLVRRTTRNITLKLRVFQVPTRV